MRLLFASSKISNHFHLKAKTQSSYVLWTSSKAWWEKVWIQTDVDINIYYAIYKLFKNFRQFFKPQFPPSA
jgi:hypothetical protein